MLHSISISQTIIKESIQVLLTQVLRIITSLFFIQSFEVNLVIRSTKIAHYIVLYKIMIQKGLLAIKYVKVKSYIFPVES